MSRYSSTLCCSLAIYMWLGRPSSIVVCQCVIVRKHSYTNWQIMCKIFKSELRESVLNLNRGISSVILLGESTSLSSFGSNSISDWHIRDAPTSIHLVNSARCNGIPSYLAHEARVNYVASRQLLHIVPSPTCTSSWCRCHIEQPFRGTLGHNWGCFVTHP